MIFSGLAILKTEDVPTPYDSEYQWVEVSLGYTVWKPSAPAIIIPKSTLPLAIAAGAAALIIKNPTVSRRFWSGWLK